MKPWAKFHQNLSLSETISNFPFVFGPQSVWLPNIYRKTCFSETDLGIAPQAEYNSYPPLVWPLGCPHKMPKRLTKNILKKLKRKMWVKAQPGFTLGVDAF